MSAGPVPSIQLAPREPFAVLDGSLFLPKAPCLDIYIDEQWPGTFDAGRRSEGIVTALVMRGGGSPNLPQLSNHHFHRLGVTPHRKLLSACDAINALLRTRRIFPVVLQLFTLRADANECREAVLSAAVRLLFGVILRGRSNELVTVRFFLDRDDYKGYTLSYDPAPVFRAVLAHAVAEHPELFGCWKVGDCEVLDAGKSTAMAYADLLGHVIPRNDPTPSSTFASWASIADWPGHLQIDEESVSKLLDAVQCRGSKSAIAILDLLDDLAGTAFGETLLKNIATGIDAQPLLRNEVLSILEGRYRDKNRNIRQLNSQYILLREHLLKASPARPPKHLQLLVRALEFHYANHRGSPLDPDVQKAARDYRRIWRDLFAANTGLAASVNAKVVVHYCDQFDFSSAQAFLQELVQPDYMRFLDDRSRGIILSTQGQLHAIQGEYAAADDLFSQAIKLFEQMEPELGTPEIRQTSIYRAMALLDSDPVSAKPLLLLLLGNLEAAAERLVGATEPVSAWDHHLLLRAIYLLSRHRDEEAAAAQSAYLRVKRDDWATGDTHPWELIYLYRALLLYTTGDDSEAGEEAMQELFKTAALICRSKGLGKGHGITLNIICAMINTAAVVTVEDSSRGRFERLARREIATVRKALPKSKFLRHALRDLEAILARPEDYSAESALKILPFNYH